MMKKLFAMLLAAAMLCLCGCAKSYSESEVEKIKKEAYNEGYEVGRNKGSEDGYSAGYSAGYSDGVEDGFSDGWNTKDYDDYLINGKAITDLRDEVYVKYGLTPHEAFSMVDEYEYDWTHGGITWDEYQNAIAAIYYTAERFPYE